jgi:membrane protease subunit HflK
MSTGDPFPFRAYERRGGGSAPSDGPPFPFNLPSDAWKWVLGALAALLVLWGAMTSFYTVQPEQRAVVKRFGAVVYQTDPGLHFKVPFGVDRVQLVPTERVLKEEFGFRTHAQEGNRAAYRTAGFDEESLTLTGDLNIIKVEWVVQYRISDAIKWLYQVREAEETLRDISEAVMRQIVGNRLGSDVLTVARADVSMQARQEIQAIMDGYKAGVHIITVELQDVLPTERVQPAFNDVNIARQERERMINEAEKRRNQVIPRVRGQANQLAAEAEGYAAERVNNAHGEVARFSAILGEYKNAPEVTRRRLYLEMIGDVLPRAGKLMVVQQGQQGPLPLLDLQKGAASRATKTVAKAGGAQ